MAVTPVPRILIVDDDRTTLRMLSLPLEAAGYTIATASDGATALARLARTRFDLVLLDVWMPGGAATSLWGSSGVHLTPSLARIPLGKGAAVDRTIDSPQGRRRRGAGVRYWLTCTTFAGGNPLNQVDEALE